MEKILTIYENKGEVGCRVGEFPELNGVIVSVKEDIFNIIMLSKDLKPAREKMNELYKENIDIK